MPPLGPRTSYSDPRLSRLGQGSPGGLQRPVGLLNGPRTIFSPAETPRIQQQPLQKVGKPLPKDLAYQAKTQADIISNMPTLTMGLNDKGVDPKKQAEARAIARFEAMNLPPEYMTQVKDILTQRRAYGEKQNAATFQAAMKVLNVFPSMAAGFMSGTHQFQVEHGITSWQDQWKYAAHPSYLFKEFNAGFRDVPDAALEGKSMDEMIRETNTPGSFAYRYAMPIGLGMSILFDPTTYLTFGASSAAKSTAYHVLAEADRRAANAAADRIWKNYGSKIETHHGEVVANWHNLDVIMSDVKIKNNLPITLGDALDVQKAEGLAIKSDIRKTGKYWSGKTGEIVDASARQKLTARVLPNNVKGGRGIRFAGVEIPGTARRGADLAARVRAPAEDFGRLPNAVGEMMIPQWGARHVVDDAARASALVEMANYRTAMSRVQMNIGRETRSMQNVQEPILGLGNEAEEAMHGIASEGPQFRRVLVGPEERANLHKRDISELTPAQRILKHNINTNADLYIIKAKEAGIDEKEITRLWHHTLDYYEDPLMALGEFKFKASARAMSRNFTEQVLKDPRFAIPMNSKAAAEAILRKDFLESGVDLGKLDEAPRGFTEFNHGNRRYAVRNSIVEGLREINNPTRLDNSIHQGMRVLNIPQNYWKLYATAPNPAFHVMNFLGAVWNNMLAGVYNPADYFDAMKLLYSGRKEEAAQAGARFGVTRQIPHSTEKGLAAQEKLTEAEARAGLGRSSFLFSDVSRGNYTAEQLAMTDLPLDKSASIFEQLQSSALKEGRGFVKRQVTRAPDQSKKRFAYTSARKATGTALAVTGNPLAFAMFLPEAANVGRKLGGTIEDIVRLAPFSKFSDDPAVRRVLANYGPINSSMKVTHKGFTKQDQQIMYDIGAHISRHFQFDYSDLTTFERYFAKTVFPFWVYYKKNTALQVAQLAHKPVTFAVANRIMNFSNENSDMDLGPWKDILPGYFNNINAFQIPVPNKVRGMMGLPEDQPLYLNPKMPFLSINLIPNFVDIIRNPTETNSQKMLEVVAPLFGSVGPFAAVPIPGVKILLEAGTGHNLGLNRPIDYQRASSNDLRQSYVPAPGWIKYVPDELHKFFGVRMNEKAKRLEMSATSKYVLEQMSSPFINNLGQAIPAAGATSEDQGKAKANLISWLTGVRLIPVDVLRLDRNAAYTLLDQLEAEQSDLRSQGKQLSRERQVMLARVRSDIKVINVAYDQREADPSSVRQP